MSVGNSFCGPQPCLSVTDKIILWHVAESDVSGDSDSLSSVNSDSELGEPALERYTHCFGCWLLVIVIRKLTYLCVPMSVSTWPCNSWERWLP